MIKALTIVGLLMFIAAGTALLYRNQPYSIVIERTGEVKKDQEKASVVAAQPVQLPTPFGPVPYVQPAVAGPTVTAEPAVTAPTPVPVKRVKHKKKRKHTAAQKLKKDWVLQ